MFFITDSELFKKSLDEGSLDITVATVMFTGISSVNAKRIVFQEPITLKPQSKNHNIYLRLQSYSELLKLHHENCNESLFYSLNLPEHSELIEEESTKSSQALDLSFAEKVSVSKSMNRESSVFAPISGTTIEYHNLDQSKNEPIIPTQISADVETSSQSHTESTLSIQVSSDIETTPDRSYSEKFYVQKNEFENADESTITADMSDAYEFFKDSDDIDYLMNLSRCKTKGKLDIIHGFSCDAYLYMKEIISIFVKKVTAGVLVIHSSEQIKLQELDILKQMSSVALNGFVIESTASLTNQESKNVMLKQFNKFLVHEEEVPGSYILSINCMQPQIKDLKTGARIIEYAINSTPTNTLPFSWYLLGFKLYTFMLSRNIHAVNVSKQAMMIASTMNMDRTTVEAALEHLSGNNIVLYFKDILNDIVFINVEPFAVIFSELLQKYNKGSGQTVLSHSNLAEIVERYADDIVSVENYVMLFTKLLIMAPYKEFYMIPSFLPLLNEKEKEAASMDRPKPLLIKCPSSGYEFMSMLIVYLLTIPNSQWEVLENVSGKPECLYKNYTKLFQKNTNCILIISFTKDFIELSQHYAKFSPVLKIILHGLKKIKLTLNFNQNFDFSENLYVQCSCSKFNDYHTSRYNRKLDKLVCEKTEIEISLNDTDRKWLKSGQFLCFFCSNHFTIVTIIM